MPSYQPRIAIVGGGPAGLAMGLLLHQHCIPYTIFELRQKPTDEELRKPSGMLDLHEGSGLTVMKECGLYDDFIPLTGECSQDFVVADKDGKVLHTLQSDGARPEVSRNNLTKLFLATIPPENLKWGHKLLSATRPAGTDSVETELDFGTHGKYTFDFVAGADGAWSVIRKLLTDQRPEFTGMYNATLTIKHITEKYPHLVDLIGTGSFTSLGRRHGVISQRGSYDSARIFIWLTVADINFTPTVELVGKPASSAKDKLLKNDELLGTFGDTIKDLVATACDEETADNPGASLDIRALHTIPYGSSWAHQKGVTLVGDAAHLMLPNGEGVNFAMFDSLLLSRAIIKAWTTAGQGVESFQAAIDPLLKAYEAGMMVRAKEAATDTERIIGSMFGSDDAAQRTADLLRSFGEPPSPEYK